MSFNKTLLSLLCVGLCVLSLAEALAATETDTSTVEVANTNLTRLYGGSHGHEVNNFPVNALPPLTYSPKQYTVYSTNVTFYTAWHLCRSRGKRLASIESTEDHEAYREAIAPYATSTVAFWIAGTNVGAIASEYRKFYWITNDRPVGYVSGFENWLEGSAPNEANRCMATYLPSAMWIYGSCTSNSFYVCEESPDV
uniref:C-type lectin domain-containing protein n=1 Tax=Anopheles culicifacies TaxID=139723 RepID=A0A182LS65_9DIPT